MFNIIEKYIQNMTKNDVLKFAHNKSIFLNEEELDFTYNFIKKNYKELLKNPNLLDIDKYKSHYTKENFSKITKVFQEYYQKYNSYL